MHTTRKLLLRALLLVALAALAACQTRQPPAAGSVVGTVTYPDGTPAAGAELILKREDAPPSAPATEAATDDAGSFSLQGVRVGVYDLTVRAGAEYAAFVPGTVVSENEQSTVNVALAPVGAVAGTARLSDLPAASAGTLVYVPGSAFATQTAADGSFVLSGLPEGDHELRLEAPGYAAVDLAEVTVVGGETTALGDVTLERRAPYADFAVSASGASVSVDASASFDADGVIVDYTWDFGDGRKVSGPARFTYTYTSSGPKTITLTVTDDDGYSSTASREVDVTLPQLRAGAGPYARTVPAGGAAHWEVAIPRLAGDLLYLEVAGAPAIEVRHAGAAYYSTSPNSFALLDAGSAVSAGASAAPTPTPSAIVVGRVCRGPCVLLPNGSGSALLTVHNPAPAPLDVDIFLEAESFSDLNEPNDTRGQATPLSGDDSGATELIGDQDHFVLTRGGDLTFDGPTALTLRAAVYDAGGALLGELASGETRRVQAGEHVVISAPADVAAPAGASAYYLTLE